MTTAVQILTPEQVQALPSRAREVVEYRKSGLSLNHIQGCPLDCAYCIRHTYGLWDQRQPRALLGDEEAVEQLLGHRYFTPHVTPLQLFNRATDPFLPQVKQHTFAVVTDLDKRGLRNHLLIITRYRVTDSDCEQLAAIRHLRLTLLFTFSGIEGRRIEPYPSSVAAESLQIASQYAPRRYRTVLYWRPLVPGLNDSPVHLAQAARLSRSADATVFTGLFLREEIAAVTSALPELGELQIMSITPRAMVVSGLASEQPRYYLQHALGFQVHDAAHPHRAGRHGRAEIGWEDQP